MYCIQNIKREPSLRPSTRRLPSLRVDLETSEGSSTVGHDGL